MSINPNREGNFQINAKDIIFFEGQPVNSVNILMQGKMEVFLSPFEKSEDMPEASIVDNSYRLFDIGKNIFTGAGDIFREGEYSFTFRAMEDCTVHAFIAQDIKGVKELIDAHRDFGAYIITSLSNLIDSSYSALNNLLKHVRAYGTLVDNLVMTFWALKEEYGFSFSPSSSFFRDGLEFLRELKDNKLTVQAEFDEGFLNSDHSSVTGSVYSPDTDVNRLRIEYYRRLPAIPADLCKSFFRADGTITEYHIIGSSDVLNELQSALKDSFKLLDTCFKKLFAENGESVFSEYVRAAYGLKGCTPAFNNVIRYIDFISNTIKEFSGVYEKEYQYKPKINIGYIDGICSSLNSGFSTGSKSANDTGTATEDIGSIPDELRDSTAKILEYSGIAKEKAQLFMKGIEAFRNLKDKLSSGDEARNIRSSISSLFFEVYEAVFRRVHADKNEALLYKMFLNFSYMDERLLSSKNTMLLYSLAAKTVLRADNVYTISDWLGKIYSMEKDPSINEFGQDYFDVFREMHRNRNVSSKEKLDYNSDADGRLGFETANMFKTNHKICYGQISTYFPVLHDDMITRDLSKAFITPEMIKDSVSRVLEVDFSAFHREINYRNPDKGIEKELIMKQVIPDFILMPVFGSRSIMWQELAGRDRGTPGRILLPVFTSENLDDIIVKMIGNLRWELCRTMMGVGWNDITEKSLTSEYADYIQFYRKNRDLSDEAKDKIKMQVQKFNNRLRDIFTADYETWVNYEAKGVIRLNKVARRIFYRYCPFSKPIRDYLEKSPLFSDLSVPFRNQRAKLAREFENHYARLSKGSGLDPELEENLRFYKDM